MTAPDRSITLAVEGDARVLGDAHQLRQVLGNLLRNALVHTPAGTPIEVGVGVGDERVRVEVRDHGPGLPDGDPDALFERFWRAEAGRERGKAGAGLGVGDSGGDRGCAWGNGVGCGRPGRGRRVLGGAAVGVGGWGCRWVERPDRHGDWVSRGGRLSNPDSPYARFRGNVPSVAPGPLVRVGGWSAVAAGGCRTLLGGVDGRP